MVSTVRKGIFFGDVFGVYVIYWNLLGIFGMLPLAGNKQAVSREETEIKKGNW